ncbi:hypothetical protein GCM10011490_18080 [Pseudoclavibacter endophyticus]|uniref:Prepilin type IV endopeptidase peptidase domain-containing protein n=1 Tax=Pseudoclavibacter endophyticus TaxID=1778590 RepID=A0A6H9WPT3_9MICO|nr:prepilin peptidase [Pseudoclavibacter endophyticus]KAB1648845.1 hypothetical protein F8O04_00630 [Pseudoclavibacter endophyticus]GGA67864.1 hypothetical protein GCM10011490_18080 [Pseudoclavibacter endophyticus]
MTEGDAIRLTIALVTGIVVSVTDLRDRRIPNRVTFPAAAAVIASAVTETVWRLLSTANSGSDSGSGITGTSADAFALTTALAPVALAVLGAVVAGSAMFVLAWFGTLGFGDVKLAAVLGAALLPVFGWHALGLAFVLSYVLAFPHALVLLIARRRGGGSSELAFGPYLVVGAGAAAVAGFASSSVHP